MALVVTELPRYSHAITRAFGGVSVNSQPEQSLAETLDSSLPGAACASYWGAFPGKEVYNYTLCPAEGTLWLAPASTPSAVPDGACNASDDDSPFATRSHWLDEQMGVQAAWVSSHQRRKQHAGRGKLAQAPQPLR